MVTRIIIARHGNTFAKGETPRRVGSTTDLDLVEEAKGRAIGAYLLANDISIDAVYSGPLKRHIQTAELACDELGFDKNLININHDFNEIDYGSDENKVEEDVVLRLGNGDADKGKAIIDLWNSEAIVPEGWKVDLDDIKNAWLNFGKEVEQKHADENILLVSSNGIIRFAPELTGDFGKFTKTNDIKVGTGGLCIFEKEASDEFWTCAMWGINPAKELA